MQKDDVIYRQKAVDALMACGDWYSENENDEAARGVNQCIGVINDLPSAQIATCTNVGDTISRQAALELIHNLYPSEPIMRRNRERWKERYRQYIEVEEALERLPSAQSRWIPCSKGLPKYPFRVQIQLDNGWIITGYYSEEHWYTVPYCDGFLRNDEVEAWRELPKPYGGESDV